MNIPDTFGLRRNGQTRQEPAIPMPRVVRPQKPEVDALAAVEQALQQDTRPLPNSADAVVQAFIAMGKNIAAAMRRAGDACLEQGQRRKDEYYKAAEVAERKGEYQAREAGEFIDSIRSAHEAMAPKVVLPAAADPVPAPTIVQPAESPTEPEPPKAA